jgi:hypothetical protein
MFNLITEGVKKDIFLRNMKSYGLYDNAISLIPDVDYIKVKLDKKIKEGYYITVIQTCLEADDIIQYFDNRFRLNFKDKSKFRFIGFNKITNKGKEVTSVQFYFRMNLFDRKLCY